MIVVVIPFDSSDVARAERLCDLIYWQSGQKPEGHVLLAASHDVHGEFVEKCRIAATVAFQTVDVIKLSPVSHTDSKTLKLNHSLRETSKYIKDNYRVPFLWLEPDCVPLKRGWLKAIGQAYHSQPKRYMGCHVASGEKKYLFRVAVYPHYAFSELEMNLVEKSSKTKLIQIGKYADGMEFDKEAVIFRRDESGDLVEKLIEESELSPKRRGRPRKLTTV